MMPKNFLISQLLEVDRPTSTTDLTTESVLCDLCSDGLSCEPATYFCKQCNQCICDNCSKIHKKQSVSEFHQTVPVADAPSLAERSKSTVRYCEQHPGEQIKLYCFDCRTTSCLMCYALNHTNHNCTDVKNAGDEFRVSLIKDISMISVSISNSLKKLSEIESDEKQFIEVVDATQNEISQKYDELVSIIQSHQSQIMEKLITFKEDRLKKVENVKAEIKMEVQTREKLKTTCQELIDNGSACDISRAAVDLQVRTEELLKAALVENDLSGIDIIFTPSLMVNDIAINLFGELSFRDCARKNHIENVKSSTFLGNFSLIHVIPNKRVIRGISVLSDDLFVIRDGQNLGSWDIRLFADIYTSYNFTNLRKLREFEVYDSTNFVLKRKLTISGSKALWAVVACSENICLYLSDDILETIYRYDLQANTVINTWKVGGKCRELSLTKLHTVLVTFANQIQEYKPNGDLGRCINILCNFESPRHCIQQSNNHFVVSFLAGEHGVLRIVNENGHKVQTYEGCSPVGMKIKICHLAVTKEGYVIASDFNNNRVLLFSQTLALLSEINIPGNQLSGPYALHLDEVNHRLYIGEAWSGRLFVLCISIDKDT